MRGILRPALSTLFAGELKPLAPSHSTVYNDGALAQTQAALRCGGAATLSLLSWNLLAPCYKRPAEPSPDARIRAQTAVVRASHADIVSLQEFWLEPEHLRMWLSFATEEGFCMLVSPRSGRKRDGCCMLVRRALLTSPPEVEALSYNDWGDRVVQLVTLRLALAGGHDPLTLTLAHTHLTFPHEGGHDREMRWHQARKLATLVHMRAQQHPVLVVGDLNGDVEDEAVALLLASGGLKPMSQATDWISHVAHNGKLMACDILAVADARPDALPVAASGVPGGGGLLDPVPRCRVSVGEWSFGGTQEELLSGNWLSDHRPLSVSLELHEE